jgi:hypothetical protein
MGRTCNTHGREAKCMYKILVEKLKGIDHSEDLGIDGKIIYLNEIIWGVYCIQVA